MNLRVGLHTVVNGDECIALNPAPLSVYESGAGFFFGRKGAGPHWTNEYQPDTSLMGPMWASPHGANVNFFNGR